MIPFSFASSFIVVPVLRSPLRSLDLLLLLLPIHTTTISVNVSTAVVTPSPPPQQQQSPCRCRRQTSVGSRRRCRRHAIPSTALAARTGFAAAVAAFALLSAVVGVDGEENAAAAAASSVLPSATSTSAGTVAGDGLVPRSGGGGGLGGGVELLEKILRRRAMAANSSSKKGKPRSGLCSYVEQRLSTPLIHAHLPGYSKKQCSGITVPGQNTVCGDTQVAHFPYVVDNASFPGAISYHNMPCSTILSLRISSVNSSRAAAFKLRNPNSLNSVHCIQSIGA